MHMQWADETSKGELLAELGVRRSKMPVPAKDQAQIRRSEEVARRCAVLYGRCSIGFDMDRARIVKWLRREGLWNDASPDERVFFTDTAPSKQELIDATWEIEKISVLLWALDRIDDLELPIDNCDTELLIQVLPKPGASWARFIARARLRPAIEIQDEWRLTYDIHWTLNDRSHRGADAPPLLHPGVTRERHYALNWLLCPGMSWDDISPDT